MKSLFLFLILLTGSVIPTNAFHIPTSRLPVNTVRQASTTNDDRQSITNLDIVLFGVGDLRVMDHGGLASLSPNSAAVLPLFLLDTKDTLPNIPMATTHTFDSASMISASIQSLQSGLRDIGLKLHIKSSPCENNMVKTGVVDLLNTVLKDVEDLYPEISNVTIHVCDLGMVDNQLGYSPFSYVRDFCSTSSLEVNIRPWNCHLRNKSWNDVQQNANQFPDKYTDYESQYINENVNKCFETPKLLGDQSWTCLEIPSMNVPSSEKVKQLLLKALDYDSQDPKVMKVLEQEQNTGLFATHWGGLNIEKTFNMESVVKVVNLFLGLYSEGVDGDDALVANLDWWSNNILLSRNPLSLEHAAIIRMMKRESKVQTENLIDGELFTRCLAAPLLYGLVSSRYLLNQTILAKSRSAPSFLDSLIPSVMKKKNTIDVATTLVEAREWHKLFATKSLILSSQDEGISVYFWRWHGFLCRYEGKASQVSDEITTNKGIVLVHGFGASGSQWRKAVNALSALDECRDIDILSPDLIGFGQSEKPSITYTQYLWESYTSTFVKEVAIKKKKWGSYIIGGNSIGGYTAMAAAADDGALGSSNSDVSASGAPGAKKCKGLALMNSAGKIFKKDEVMASGSQNGLSVAEATANDLLSDLSIPPRVVSSIGGTGLLWYLRPRIQSICVNLYPTNPSAVDDNLCYGILRDSLDPGALNVMISGSKLPPPRTANELLGADFGSAKSRGYEQKMKVGTTEVWFDGPVIVPQGILDPLNDAKDRANSFENLRSGITVDRINAGHCPHDELPSEIASSIGSWLKVVC